MTDARFPERWLSDRRLLRLSDAAHRMFVSTLLWSVSNRTDGVIERADLPLVIGASQESATALVAAGLWAEHDNGWEIREFAATQTSADQLTVLENVRRRDREKKVRQRAEKAHSPEPTPPATEPVPGDVPGDASPGTAQERTETGQDSDRTGFIGEHLETVDNSAGEVPSDPSPFRRRFTA